VTVLILTIRDNGTEWHLRMNRIIYLFFIYIMTHEDWIILKPRMKAPPPEMRASLDSVTKVVYVTLHKGAKPMTKIDKDIPITIATPYRGIGGRMSSYPFMEMDVGDSVFYDDKSTTKSCAYSVAKKYAERSGDRKFSARKVDGGLRIWRIS